MQKKRTPFELNYADLDNAGNTSNGRVSRTESWSEHTDQYSWGLHANHQNRLHRPTRRTSTSGDPRMLRTSTIDGEQSGDHERIPLKHSRSYPTIIPVEGTAHLQAMETTLMGFWGRHAQRCIPLIRDAFCVLCDLPVLLLLGCMTRAVSHIPARRAFMLKSKLHEYAYPLEENTIPGDVNLAMSVVPLVVLTSVYHVFWRPKPGWREWYRTLVCLACAVLLSTLITDLVKIAVGRPRPNFIAHCWKDGVIRFSSEDKYGGYPECFEEDKQHSSSHKSFPSDHSSTSASGLGLLSFWLAGKLRVFSGPSKIWQLLVSMVPSVGAVAVGLTRIADHQHHAEDVCTGLAIGFGAAFLLYLQVWPFWTHPMCHEPHPEGQTTPLAAQGSQVQAPPYPHAQPQRPPSPALSQELSLRLSP